MHCNFKFSTSSAETTLLVTLHYFLRCSFNNSGWKHLFRPFPPYFCNDEIFHHDNHDHQVGKYFNLNHFDIQIFRPASQLFAKLTFSHWKFVLYPERLMKIMDNLVSRRLLNLQTSCKNYLSITTPCLPKRLFIRLLVLFRTV